MRIKKRSPSFSSVESVKLLQSIFYENNECYINSVNASILEGDQKTQNL